MSVISWTAKNGSNEYNERVAQTKRDWLAKHLASVHFENIVIVPYGTPKQNFGCGVLFDDEKQNRDNWRGIAYDEKNIIKILKEME